MRTIQLTKGEAEAIQWALDVMPDYWCTEQGAYERGDDLVFDESLLPKLEGHTLKMSVNKDINDDLVYRVTEQYPDVARAESRGVRIGAQRVADSLAWKLKAHPAD